MNNETNINTNTNVAAIATNKDLISSVLIVSVLVNLTVLITYMWVALDPAVQVAVSFSS